jgi:hypothetical protein
VTGVDIDVTEAGAAELSPEVTVARIGLASPAGTRQVRLHARPRYEPRNLDFAGGLDYWALGGSFTENTLQFHWQDYFTAADQGSAVLSSAAPISEDGDTAAFGVFLAGPGRIDLRDPELTLAGLA